MEQKQSVQLSDGTEISIDPDRRYTHFLRVVNGPARLDFSLTTASALHDMLNDYFGAPDPVEVGCISEAAAEVFDGRFDRLRLAETAERAA